MKRYLYLDAFGHVVMYSDGKNDCPALLEVEKDVDETTDKKVKAGERFTLDKGAIKFVAVEKSELEKIQEDIKVLKSRVGIQ